MTEVTPLSSLKEQIAPDIKSIFYPIKSEIKSVESQLKIWSKNSPSAIRAMASKVVSNYGKLLRPGLLLLVSGHLGYKGKDRISLAAAIEVVHTASLIHDDIIDNSSLRRGQETAALSFGPDFGLLLGDYLFIRSIKRSLSLTDKNVALILTRVTEEMVEGEIEELRQSFNFNLTENQYYQIIRKKTAGLFQAACELSCYLAQASEKEKAAFITYGHHLGLIFQITDDLLDITGNSAQTGKSILSDLREGRVTLPLILALKNLNPREKIYWLAELKKYRQKTNKTNYSSILKLMNYTGALEQTFAQAEKKADKARKAIHLLPDSAYRRSLLDLVDFVLYRKK